MTLKHGRQAYAAVNIDGYWIFSSLPPPARPHRSWSPNRTKRRNACNIARYSAYRIVNFRIFLDKQDVILCDHRLSSARSRRSNSCRIVAIHAITWQDGGLSQTKKVSLKCSLLNALHVARFTKECQALVRMRRCHQG